jgi:hypothetical protein
MAKTTLEKEWAKQAALLSAGGAPHSEDGTVVACPHNAELVLKAIRSMFLDAGYFPVAMLMNATIDTKALSIDKCPRCRVVWLRPTTCPACKHPLSERSLALPPGNESCDPNAGDIFCTCACWRAIRGGDPSIGR